MKQELRAEMRRRRAGWTELALEQAGNAVAERILTLPDLALPTAVGCYLSVRKELPTGALVSWLQSMGHTVAVPRVTSAVDMEFRRWEEPLEAGVLGIQTSNGPRIPVTVVICPGLAFDARGARLGYGAGYYDRWLAAHPSVVPVGICAEDAVLDEVPCEDHDRRMAYLVTPTRIVACR
ncbi:MAG: 5-formyltetrahydrofolate cyclo-ligase [Myxococcota bacterium]